MLEQFATSSASQAFADPPLGLFDRQQYRDVHGCEPGIDWKEATPDDIREAAGQEHPCIVFLSPPCKGFSGVLSQKESATQKYRILRRNL
jgi:site-specific DNA-cytosine methylase